MFVDLNSPWSFGAVLDGDSYDAVYERRKKMSARDVARFLIGKTIIGVQLCDCCDEFDTDAYQIYLEDENHKKWYVVIEGTEDYFKHDYTYPELVAEVAELNDKDKITIWEA